VAGGASTRRCSVSSTIPEPQAGQWGPDVTAFQAAMSVVSLHVAQAFIKSDSEEVHAWARELAHELKRELFDLSEPIGRHLMRMTLHQPTPDGDQPF
jgi:hypothetical protein